MKKWFSYTFLGLLALSVGLFAYHFYAANDAERKLDESIQNVTAEANLGLTVSYSSIDVDPFSGDVVFSDVNIIRDEDIQRVSSARFDLTYSDFVNITVWGTEYGLRHIEYGTLALGNLSYTNRNTLVEVKIDSLDVHYGGNLWNLIVLGITRSPARIRHKIDAAGTGFSYSQPESGAGTVRADSLQLQTHFGRQPADPDSLASSVSLTGITWSPPKPFQEKYGFFIRGFGYQTDAIPFDRASAHYQYHAMDDSLAIQNLTLRSDLFTTSIHGGIALDKQALARSQMKNFVVQLHDLSPRFKNFLGQLKKLTGLGLPVNDETIVFSLGGPLEGPEISY